MCMYMGFPGGSEVKASAWNAGDPGSIPASEDPQEKEMATHSSTLAWRIPWREEPGRLQSMGSQSRTQLSDFISTSTCGSTTGICSHGCPGRFGFAPVRARYGVVHRDSGSTRYSRGLGMATSIAQYTPVFLPGEPPSLTEKLVKPQATG